MPAHSAIITFNLSHPNNTVLDFDDFVLGNDYVHFTTAQQVPVSASGGNTIKWNYNYTHQFRINSGDKADLTELKLFGRGDGSDKQVDISFWFTDDKHKKIQSTVQTWVGLQWPANLNKILYGDWPHANGNDVLGVLKDIVIADFHLEIKVNHGEVAFGGGRVDWEASDITATPTVPEPATVALLGLGLALIYPAKKRRRVS